MKIRTKTLVMFYLTFTLISNSNVSFAQNVINEAVFKAGAAKVNITPGLNELPKGWLGIYDSIHSRAIVVSDGKNTVALVTIDIGGMSNEMASSLLKK
jgi:hypothetical protein